MKVLHFFDVSARSHVSMPGILKHFDVLQHTLIDSPHTSPRVLQQLSKASCSAFFFSCLSAANFCTSSSLVSTPSVSAGLASAYGPDSDSDSADSTSAAGSSGFSAAGSAGSAVVGSATGSAAGASGAGAAGSSCRCMFMLAARPMSERTPRINFMLVIILKFIVQLIIMLTQCKSGSKILKVMAMIPL